MLTPAYKLTFGAPAGGSGGLAGAATAAAQKLTGGGGAKVIDTTDEPKVSTVVDLVVTLDLDTPADSLVLVMGNVGGFKPSRDDSVSVELGYADNGGLTRVLSAKIVVADPGLETVRFVAYSGADGLLRAYTDQTYESKTAGAIVRDLAGKAGIDVATADDGITFPAYVTDGRRSVLAHMQDLADLSGFDLYIDPDGKLVFQKFTTGKTVHVFEYAKHVVALDVTRQPAGAGRVEAWGESPTGSQGENAWPWLTKDFSSAKGSSGSGDPLFLLERPALRTAAAAQAAAEAAATRIQRQALRGRLVSVGRPEVKLGDAIRLSGLPDGTLNKNFQVRAVTHRINKRTGFTTTIRFRAIDTP